MGDTKTAYDRPIKDYGFMLPFEVAHGETVRCYIRAQSRESLFLLFHLWDEETLHSQQIRHNVVLGGLIAIVVVMMFYNLLVYSVIHDKSYLYYVLYIFFATLSLLCFRGIAFRFFWPEAIWWHHHSLQVTGFLYIAALLLFSRQFLDTRAETPKVDRALHGLFPSSLGVIPISLVLPVSVGMQLSATFVFLANMGALGTGLYRAIAKYRPAYYFLVAFTVLLLTNAIQMGAILFSGVPGVSGIVSLTYIYEFGMAAQITLLAFGLADRINLMREETEHLQRSAIWFQERAREELEREVAVQTSELREKTEQLKELDQQKTTFFQNISHELRTPLTLILNPLLDETMRNPNNRNTEVAMKNSRRLLRLVNQLLDFQKLSAGKRTLHLQTLDLGKFLRVCADYFGAACAAKRVALEVLIDPGPEGSGHILGEVDALEKIVFNYLSNALKYTPAGGRIVVGMERSGEYLKLYVRDSGKGIAKSQQHKLFEVFSQVDASSTREHEGTGLGLALVKQLTEAMAGQVGVESRAGSGAYFWASFPVTEVIDDGAATSSFQVRDWSLNASGGAGEECGTTGAHEIVNPEFVKGAKILVVDDLSDMREVMTCSLFLT